MIYRIRKLIKDVRRALDANREDTSLLPEADSETLALDELIASKAEEAARRVGLKAPLHLLEEGHQFGEAICWTGDGSGRTLLPDDFMRLIAFRMSDWERTLYTAIGADDPDYAKLSSRYAGIRGNPERPRAAIVNRPEGKVLEFHSCRSDKAYASIANYLPYPKVRDGGIDISERCYEAVVLTLAALTLTTYGETERAAALQELSNNLLV